MNSVIDQLAKSILQKDSLGQCSIDELQQLTDQYPYFSAAQLLLAKKLSIESHSENGERYKQQLQKTSLLFYNPLWLEYLLNGTGDAETIPAEPAEPDFSLKEEKQEPIIEERGIDSDHEPVEDSIQEEPDLPVELPAFKQESPGIHRDDPATTELTFEPYHTVDYFASQGIKFKEEEQPTDKFGLQLKSFTEWLKTLKRLPVSEIVQPADTNAEQKVEQLAGQSLQDREVITEAMAEVWKKQGSTSKAIDIYNKLSLLNPSKRAYFAAKIDELKKIM
ncbi:MAG TPA: hypothetical protein VKC90_12125 [Chitinophagaceae bacterium]|nr:hypothetical protein [Chitinophagaceae bacterium]